MKRATVCDLCGHTGHKDFKHLPLYVIGSEGIMVCLACRIALTGMASAMRSAQGRIEFRLRKKFAPDK